MRLSTLLRDSTVDDNRNSMLMEMSMTEWVLTAAGQAACCEATSSGMRVSGCNLRFATMKEACEELSRAYNGRLGPLWSTNVKCRSDGTG